MYKFYIFKHYFLYYKILYEIIEILEFWLKF